MTETGFGILGTPWLEAHSYIFSVELSMRYHVAHKKDCDKYARMYKLCPNKVPAAADGEKPGLSDFASLLLPVLECAGHRQSGSRHCCIGH